MLAINFNFKKFIILTFCFFTLNACKKSQQPIDWKTYEKKLVEINKELVRNDDSIIDAFLKKQNLNFIKTNTGLRYRIIEEGNGLKPQIGDYCLFNYNLRLLDSTLCYSSDSLGPKKIHLGYEEIEKGVLEAILLIKEGTKIQLILPPHLAWGLVGDNNCIPPRAIILYDLKLLRVYKK